MSTQRFRSFDHRSNTPRVTYQHTAWGQAPSAPITYSTVTMQGEWGNSSDEQHPGYRRMRNQGIVVLGDCTITKTNRTMNSEANFSYGPYGPSDSRNWGTERCWGDFSAWCDDRITDRLNTFDGDLSKLGDIALIESYARMNQAAVMGGEILGTINSTVSMLRSPFGSASKLLTKIAKKANRGYGKKAAYAAQATADAWLEYRYGWRPIITDIFTIMGETIDLHNREGSLQVARAGSSLERELSFQETLYGGLPRASSAKCDVTLKKEGRAAAGVIYVIKPRTTAESLMAVAGLRLNDVPSTVWELIPLSFVVDWFINTGSWIQAISPDANITVRGSWKSTVKNVTQNNSVLAIVTLGPSTPYPAVDFSGPGGSSTKSTFTFVRVKNPVLASTPLVRPTSLSLKQTLDSLALSCTGLLNQMRKL